jgi:hypothetical protein
VPPFALLYVGASFPNCKGPISRGSRSARHDLLVELFGWPGYRASIGNLDSIDLAAFTQRRSGAERSKLTSMSSIDISATSKNQYRSSE